MKKNKYESGLAELRAELAQLDGGAIAPLERLKHTLPLISGILRDLKAEVLKDGFASIEAEIHFFKYVKPAFYALQIYEADFYNITVNAPLGTNEMLRVYYEQELLYIFRFFRIHAFHYQYFRTGARELDKQYFTCDGKPGDIPILELADPFPGFSTALDYLFAKFIAYERLQNELIDKLTILYAGNSQPEKTGNRGPVMRWTGETINLVEIAYGIWLTGQLNDGNATITDIIRWLEAKLQVKIGVAYRRWTEISNRTHHPTKYTDRMREALQQRISDELDVRSNKRKARRMPGQ